MAVHDVGAKGVSRALHVIVPDYMAKDPMEVNLLKPQEDTR